MLNGLDPHSVYLTRDAFEDLQTSTNGEFSGLGLEVGMDNGFLKVIARSTAPPPPRQACSPGMSSSSSTVSPSRACP
jgi:carboxyl-terminal processing protease